MRIARMPFGGQHPLAPDRTIRPHLALDRQPKTVAGTNVAIEIHLPREHIREMPRQGSLLRHRQPVLVAREGRAPEARFDPTADDHRVRSNRDAVPRHGPKGPLDLEHQGQVRIHAELDPLRCVTWPGVESCLGSLNARPSIRIRSRHLADSTRFRGAQTAPPEQALQRLAPVRREGHRGAPDGSSPRRGLRWRARLTIER